MVLLFPKTPKPQIIEIIIIIRMSAINASEVAIRPVNNIDDKLKDCSAHRKKNMLQGIEGHWI